MFCFALRRVCKITYGNTPCIYTSFVIAVSAVGRYTWKVLKQIPIDRCTSLNQLKSLELLLLFIKIIHNSNSHIESIRFPNEMHKTLNLVNNYVKQRVRAFWRTISWRTKFYLANTNRYFANRNSFRQIFRVWFTIWIVQDFVIPGKLLSLQYWMVLTRSSL